MPSKEGAQKMKAMIALSAAVLIATAPVTLAQHVSSKAPNQRHHIAKKHPQVVSGYAPSFPTYPSGWRTGYPGTFGYAPNEPKDRALESSRQAGGGGGGGGGSGM
jgi:hypothetical protein